MNKLKSLTFLFLLFTLGTNTFCQELELDVIESQIESTRDFESVMAGIIGETDRGIYALRTNKKFNGDIEFFVARYDDKLNLIAQKPLNFKGVFESIFILNDELIMLSFQSDENGNETLLGEKLHPTSLKSIKSRALMKVEGNGKQSVLTKLFNFRSRFKLTVDSDNNRFFLQQPYKMRDKEPTYVFNSDLEKISENFYSRGFYNSILTSDNLEAYVVTMDAVTMLEDRYSYSDGERAYPYYILTFDMKETKIRDLDREDMDTVQFMLEENVDEIRLNLNGDKLIITGTVNTQVPSISRKVSLSSSDHEDKKGVFIASYDVKSRTFDYKNIVPFDRKLMVDVMGEKALGKMKKHGPGIRNLEILESVSTADGGNYIVAEQYFSKEVQGLIDDSKIMRNYGHILVMYFNPSGDLEWSKTIFKDQKVEREKSDICSVIGYVVGDNLHLFYNDTKSNFKVDDPSELKTFKQSSSPVLIHRSFDPSGDSHREIIFDNPNKMFLSLSSAYRCYRDDHAIMFVEGVKNEQLLLFKAKQ